MLEMGMGTTGRLQRTTTIPSLMMQMGATQVGDNRVEADARLTPQLALELQTAQNIARTLAISMPHVVPGVTCGLNIQDNACAKVAMMIISQETRGKNVEDHVMSVPNPRKSPLPSWTPSHDGRLAMDLS